MTARCPACRTRFATWVAMKEHVEKTGHRLCLCGGYHYPHRPGSPQCEENPMAAYNIAKAQGASDEELDDIEMDIMLFGKGRPLTRWPFG